jgi:hypothetical protein
VMALARTESAREALDVAVDAERVYPLVVASFAEVGKVKARTDASWRVTGRVEGRSLSAATVTVSVSALPGGRCRLDINSSAQRLLTQQHTATRAIARLLDALAANGVSVRP